MSHSQEHRETCGDGCGQMSRREMCRGVLRWVVLGGIAGASAALVGRRHCRRRLACGDCPALARCGLPAAAEARQNRRRPA